MPLMFRISVQRGVETVRFSNWFSTGVTSVCLRGSESGAPCLSVAIGTVGLVEALSVDGILLSVARQSQMPIQHGSPRSIRESGTGV